MLLQKSLFVNPSLSDDDTYEEEELEEEDKVHLDPDWHYTPLLKAEKVSYVMSGSMCWVSKQVFPPSCVLQSLLSKCMQVL